MSQLKQVYRCNVCGHIIEILNPGAGQLVCCGQPMELLVEKTQDEGMEKHVPVIEKTTSGYKVKIGSVPHPMEAAHYIQWIELILDGVVLRKHLNPGEVPEAEFCVCVEVKSISACEYCNVHGLWKS
jgi:superoxide reductase